MANRPFKEFRAAVRIEAAIHEFAIQETSRMTGIPPEELQRRADRFVIGRLSRMLKLANALRQEKT